MNRILPVVMLSLICQMALAQEDNIEELAGLTGFNVEASVSPRIPRDALSEELIKTDAELKLRIAGIKVCTANDLVASANNARIDITIDAFKHSTGDLMAFTIEVKCRQRGVLLRDPSKTGIITSWSSGQIGMLGRDNLYRIRDLIKDQIDLFINDYLKANPKTR